MNKMLLSVRSSCGKPSAVGSALGYKETQRPIRTTVHPDSAHKNLKLLTNNLSAR